MADALRKDPVDHALIAIPRRCLRPGSRRRFLKLHRRPFPFFDQTSKRLSVALRDLQVGKRNNDALAWLSLLVAVGFNQLQRLTRSSGFYAKKHNEVKRAHTTIGQAVYWHGKRT